MLSIYDDEFTEIKKSDLKNTLEIILKGNIISKDKLLHLSERIIRVINHNRCDYLITISEKNDFFSDSNYLQRQFLPLLHITGVKSLLIVFGYNEKMKVYYEELNNFLKETKKFLGINIEFFSDLESAREFIINQT